MDRQVLKKQKCIDKHGDRFDYSQTDFNRSDREENTFICNSHGVFKKLKDFLRIDEPCEKCLDEKKLKKRQTNLRVFVIRG